MTVLGTNQKTDLGTWPGNFPADAYIDVADKDGDRCPAVSACNGGQGKAHLEPCIPRKAHLVLIFSILRYGILAISPSSAKVANAEGSTYAQLPLGSQIGLSRT